MTNAIQGIDHVAITVVDLQRSTSFYCDVLGGHVANEYSMAGKVMIKQIMIGGAMLNVHAWGHGHPLVAARPTPGSADLCLRWNGPIDAAVAFLMSAQVEIVEGPVARDASTGEIGTSVYFRDPDGNLLELLSTIG